MLVRALSLIALAPTVLPQEPVDPDRVEVGEIVFHRRILDNGLRAVAAPDDGERVSVFVVVGAGKRNETPETTGLAHLTEHAMYAGTERTPLGQHDRKILAMGGESNAFTREDYTLFYDHGIPAERLDAVLAMEADRLRGLTFDREAVEYERDRLRIEEEHTWSPAEARAEQVDAAVYRRHPYRAGVLGEDRHTEAPTLSAELVKEFYDRHYHPDNVAVVVTGEIEANEALDAIAAAFGGLPRGPGRAVLEAEPPVESPRTEKMASGLPRERRECVWLVPPIDDPDRPVLDVLARILSRSVAADGSPLVATIAGRFDQDLFRLSATGPSAEAELVRLRDRAREELFDTELVAEVVSLLRNDFTSLPLRARPYLSLAGTFGVYEVYGQVDRLAGYAEAIAVVNPERVREVAVRHLSPDRQVTVVFERSGEPPKPLPDDGRALQQAAEDAVESGDLERAIAAYDKLLTMGPNRMFQVIYLSSRGQVRVQQKDYEGAIADYEAALRVVDYPAVRDLLDEARALARGAGSRRTEQPASRPTDR